MSEAYYEHPVSCPECGLPTNFLVTITDPETKQTRVICEWCEEGKEREDEL